jgi:2-polyprenyl-3-methyl-5-hydroxy-6-metoxy-1,4-benzoquinol methylase
MRYTKSNLKDYWNGRASTNEGLYAVFSRRWADTDCDLINSQQIGLIKEVLGDFKGKRVLDIGCGIGRLTTELARDAKDAVGIDISSMMIDKAKRNNACENLAFYVEDITNLPSNYSDFDIAIAIFVFQHIPDDDLFHKGVACIQKSLKPQGKLITVDGVTLNETFQPENSEITTIRSKKYYMRIFEAYFQNISTFQSTYADDHYTTFFFEKR